MSSGLSYVFVAEGTEFVARTVLDEVLTTACTVGPAPGRHRSRERNGPGKGRHLLSIVELHPVDRREGVELLALGQRIGQQQEGGAEARAQAQREAGHHRRHLLQPLAAQGDTSRTEQHRQAGAVLAR